MSDLRLAGQITGCGLGKGGLTRSGPEAVTYRRLLPAKTHHSAVNSIIQEHVAVIVQVQR